MADNAQIKAGITISADTEGGEEISRLAGEINSLAAELAQINAEYRELQKSGATQEELAAAAAVHAAKVAEVNGKLKEAVAQSEKLKKIADAKTTLGLDVKDNLRAELKKVDAAYQTLKASGKLTGRELRAATEAHRAKVAQLRTEIENADNANRKMGGGFGAAASSALKFGAAAVSVGAVKKAIEETLAVSREFEQLEKRFTYAFGDAGEAAKQLDFVRETANRLWLEMMSAANGYSQLASATKNLNISHQDTQQIFSGVASAVAAMGLSANDANGVFLALSQIAGKGKVSMEELRQQLGERLTPAMSIAAQSMGVTTAELEKMVESGISAEEFLPKFGAAMQEAFGAEAAKNVETFNGRINLLKNQFTDLLKGFADGGITDGAMTLLEDAGRALDAVKEMLDGAGDAFGGDLKDALSSAYELVKELFTSTWDALTRAGSVINNIGAMITSVSGNSAKNFNLLKSSIQGVSIIIGGLRDALEVLNITADLAAGAILRGFALISKGISKISFGEMSEGFKRSAQELEAAAEEHFTNALDRVDGFASKTKAALDKAVDSNTIKANFAEVEKNSREALQKAIQAAQEAQQQVTKAQADAATLGSEFAKQQLQAAQIAAETAKTQAASLFDTYKTAAKDADISPEIEQSILEPLRALGVKVDTVVQNQKLVDVFQAAKTSAEQLGVKIDAVGASISQSFQKQADDLNNVQAHLDEFAQRGMDTAAIVRQALEKMVSSAQNVAEIQHIEKELREMGAAGVLSADQVDSGLLNVNLRLLEIQGALDPLTAAFKKLGIQTKEVMAANAQSLITAFNQVKASGQATEDALDKAFKRAADAALASGDIAQQSWVGANAAAHGYTMQIDESGNAALRTTETVKQAAAAQAQAYKETSAQIAQSTAEAEEKIRTTVTMAKNAIPLFADEVEQFNKLHREQFISWAHGFRGRTQLLSQAVQGYRDDIKAAADGIEELNRKTADGSVTTLDIANAAALAQMQVGKLGKERLAQLQAAIDSARAKLRAMADEARQTRQALEMELAGASGDSQEVERLEKMQKLGDLQKKLNEAQRTGNKEAEADFRRSMELTNQIYAQKQKQREEEERQRQQEEAQRQREAAQRQREADARAAARAQKNNTRQEKPAQTEIPAPAPLHISGMDSIGSGIAGIISAQMEIYRKQIEKDLPQILMNELKKAERRLK